MNPDSNPFFIQDNWNDYTTGFQNDQYLDFYNTHDTAIDPNWIWLLEYTIQNQQLPQEPAHFSELDSSTPLPSIEVQGSM